jgi:hypothetical protein
MNGTGEGVGGVVGVLGGGWPDLQLVSRHLLENTVMCNLSFKISQPLSSFGGLCSQIIHILSPRRQYNQISCQISFICNQRSLGKILKPAASFISLFRLRHFLKSISWPSPFNLTKLYLRIYICIGTRCLQCLTKCLNINLNRRGLNVWGQTVKLYVEARKGPLHKFSHEI